MFINYIFEEFSFEIGQNNNEYKGGIYFSDVYLN